MRGEEREDRRKKGEKREDRRRIREVKGGQEKERG